MSAKGAVSIPLPPLPGQCVLVWLQSGPKAVADVMKLSESCDAALCKTIKSKRTFWLHPQCIHAKKDPTILKWELMPERDEKIDFRGHEIQRLHRALHSDGRLGTLRGGGAVKKYSGFVTAPSQYCVRVIRNLADGADPVEDVDDPLSEELKKSMDIGAKEVLRRFRELPEGMTPDRIWQHKGESRVQFLATVQGRQPPPKRLKHGQEFKCYAEFECLSDVCSRHRWDSTMAWALYDGKRGGHCECPAKRRAIVGCIHEFRSPDWEGRKITDTRPFQRCKRCNSMCHATVCELLHDQGRNSGHQPELCPKCIEFRGWCDRRKVDEGTAQAYDLSLQIVDAQTMWTASEAGVEAKVMCEGSEFLVQMRP
jgi:hypothetical protein